MQNSKLRQSHKQITHIFITHLFLFHLNVTTHDIVCLHDFWNFTSPSLNEKSEVFLSLNLGKLFHKK